MSTNLAAVQPTDAAHGVGQRQLEPVGLQPLLSQRGGHGQRLDQSGIKGAGLSRGIRVESPPKRRPQRQGGAERSVGPPTPVTSTA
jgi:hypothetical protein